MRGRGNSLLQNDQQVIGVDLDAFFHDDFLHDSVLRCGDGGEHFHGLDDDKFVAGFDLGAGGDGDFGDHAGEGGADLGGVGGVAFSAGGGGGGGEGFVHDDGFAGHAVEFVEEGALAVRVRLTDGDELDDEDFPGVDLDLDFLADLETVEEGGGGELAEVVVFGAAGLEVFINAGIHQVGVDGVLGLGIGDW